MVATTAGTGPVWIPEWAVTAIPYASPRMWTTTTTIAPETEESTKSQTRGGDRAKEFGIAHNNS